MYTYRAYDLIFSSELLIPELEVAEGTPDVTIRIGTVPLQLSNPIETRRFFQAGQDEFLLKLEKTAGYYVKDGSEITIEPYIDSSAPDIRLFLLGSVFGALLHQRGYLVLHGSSVVINGRGVLITGESGIGKSTLAAAFNKKAYEVLTDDVCAVNFSDDGTPYIVPGFPSLKLWPDAADRLETSVDGLEPVKSDIEKYRVEIKKGYCTEKIALKEIYLLGKHDGEKVEIVPVKDLAKLEALIKNTYRPRYLNGQKLKSLHFSQCVAVAGKTDIYSVLRPETGFLLDELVTAVEGNVNDHDK